MGVSALSQEAEDMEAWKKSLIKSERAFKKKGEIFEIGDGGVLGEASTCPFSILQSREL